MENKLFEFFLKYFQIIDLKLNYVEFKDMFFESFKEASVGYIHPLAIEEEFENFYNEIIYRRN